MITDQHITEALKLEYWIPKVRDYILPGSQFEVELMDSDFHGFIDLLSPVPGFHDQPEPNLYDLYDFKYTSRGKRYLDSDQLHLYKYFFEKLNPGKYIRNLTYIIIPKVNPKFTKYSLDVEEYRKRVLDECKKQDLEFLTVDYDPDKVIDFFRGCKTLLETNEFPKQESYLCNYCEYQEYCEKGVDYMILPKCERRNLNQIQKKVIWIYGNPFSGKTYFANKFPNPIMLNTDGNIRFVDSPFISIKDQVVMDGRISKRTMAWEVFEDTITELEKKQNDFKTIIVDLLEDVYESCRLWCFEHKGFEHESDAGFGKGYDIVRTEFLSTIRKLINLDYENIILISHADSSRDITKKSGDKMTVIKPNLQDKVANKVAGMVDIVARVISEQETRTLSFKTSENIFGGGRLTISENEIPLEYDDFIKVYEEANRNASSAMGKTEDQPRKKEELKPTPVEVSEEEPPLQEVPVEAEQPPKEAETPVPEAKPEQEAPKPTRTRKRREA